MRGRAFLMLGLAALLGAVAVFLARGWIETQTRQVVATGEQPQVNLTTVVVAKRPLALGDRLTREHLHEARWPADAVPSGSFNRIDELVGGEPRVALRNIQVNEPVLRDRVSGFGGRATLSAVLDQGARGVTIRINDVLGVAGFVMPGDRVDLLLTRDVDKEPITNVLMQNVKVLGIDQDANDSTDKPKVARTATVEVNTEQAQKLALASQVGTLSLALRHMLNKEPTEHRTIRVRDLVDDGLVKPTEVKPVVEVKAEAPRAAVTPARRATNPFASVRVVRGMDATTQEVLIERGAPLARPATGEPMRLSPVPAPTAPTVTVPASEAPKPTPAPAAPATREADDKPMPLLRERISALN